MNKVLPYLEKVVRTLEAEQSFKSVLIEDKCWKRIYERGDYELVVYKSPESPANVKGMMGKANSPELTRQCFERGLSLAKKLNLPFVDRVIEKDKAFYPQLWEDPHVGLVRWLQCSATDPIDFKSSVATMIHELSHGLNTDNCMFLSSKVENICFNFSSD